jgi:hypothetical protein
MRQNCLDEAGGDALQWAADHDLGRRRSERCTADAPNGLIADVADGSIYTIDPDASHGRSRPRRRR